MEVAVKAIDTETAQRAPERAHQDVAGIVETEVDAGITAQQGVGHEGEGDPRVAVDKGEEGADGKAVGGMTGEEAVEPAATAIDKVNETGQGGFVGGTETLHQGFADATGSLVGQQDGQTDHEDNEADTTVVVGTEQHEEEEQVEEYPRGYAGDAHPEAVPIDGVAAVEQEQKLLVEVY